MKLRSVVSTVVFAVVLALGLVFTGGLMPGVARQAATPTAPDLHPIIGAWQWINNPDAPDANPSYAVFNDGGTYVELDSPVGVGIGAWQATGPRTADLTIIFQDADADPDAITPGTSIYRIAAEVDATGNAITATGELEVRDATGATVSIEPFTGTATRVMVEPPGLGSVSIPVATPAG